MKTSATIEGSFVQELIFFFKRLYLFTQQIVCEDNVIQKLNLLAQPVLFLLILERLDKYLHAIPGWSTVLGPSLGGETLVSLEECLVGTAVGEASSPYTQVLHQAEVFHLVGDEFVVELHWRLKKGFLKIGSTV